MFKNLKFIPVFFLLIFSTHLKGQTNVTLDGIEMILSKAQDHFITLAESFSQEQLEWKPADGVMTTSKVILHVASTNYFLCAKLGAPTPADVDTRNLQNLTKKADIINIAKKSVEFVRATLKTIDPATFSEKVNMPFGDFNKLTTILQIVEHTAEHKGQLIAYARSNGITPPWSK